MAWENDRIAHRMYGFALNSPVAAAAGERLRGSGIDVWAKRVTYPIVDRWYAKGHDQFHKDEEGEGARSLQHRRLARCRRHGLWDGSEALDLGQLRRRAGCCRTVRGARPSS